MCIVCVYIYIYRERDIGKDGLSKARRHEKMHLSLSKSLFSGFVVIYDWRSSQQANSSVGSGVGAFKKISCIHV